MGEHVAPRHRQQRLGQPDIECRHQRLDVGRPLGENRQNRILAALAVIEQELRIGARRVDRRPMPRQLHRVLPRQQPAQ